MTEWETLTTAGAMLTMLVFSVNHVSILEWPPVSNSNRNEYSTLPSHSCNAIYTHLLLKYIIQYTVLSRKSAHGRCILLSHQTRGWALFRVFPHSTLKERPHLFTYTSSAIAAIEQQARVSQSPPSTSTSLESLATSPLTTSSSLPPSAG